MARLTCGSLFAGIGGFDLGFERAGFDIRWQVEIDPWARAVLAKHWPHVHRRSDVHMVGAHNLECVDVICGGFPCQDISAAGTGEGIKGSRSRLWFEYARIIRELQPRYVVVENSPRLMSRGLGSVIGDLAACGYDAEWDCLPAAAFGAPHLRDRLWVIASRRKLRHRRVLLVPTTEGEVPDAYRGGCEVVRQSELDELESSRGSEPDGLPIVREFDNVAERSATWWLCEPGVRRVVDGVPRKLDRLRGLGNAVIPFVAEYLARRILAAEREAV
jgi:DNA (cytosine-5)-methyltransferase 1